MNSAQTKSAPTQKTSKNSTKSSFNNKPKSKQPAKSKNTNTIIPDDSVSHVLDRSHKPAMNLLRDKGYVPEGIIGEGVQGIVIKLHRDHNLVQQGATAESNKISKQKDEFADLDIDEYFEEDCDEEDDYEEKNDKSFAAKIVQDHTLTTKAKERLDLEIKTLKAINHPHVLKFVDVLHTNDTENQLQENDLPAETCIITEFIAGKDLADVVNENSTIAYGDAAEIMAQLILAVAYLHDRGISHRDIKLENVMCDKFPNDFIHVTERGLEQKLTTRPWFVKLIDFGAVHHRQVQGPFSKDICGSPAYFCPEMCVRDGQKPRYFAEEADIWSLGVMFYTMIHGSFPFGETLAQVSRYFQKHERIALDFEQGCWKQVPEIYKDLIAWMLNKEGRDRPSAMSVLECLVDTNNISARDLGFPVPKNDRNNTKMDGKKLMMFGFGGFNRDEPNPSPNAAAAKAAGQKQSTMFGRASSFLKSTENLKGMIRTSSFTTKSSPANTKFADDSRRSGARTPSGSSNRTTSRPPSRKLSPTRGKLGFTVGAASGSSKGSKSRTPVLSRSNSKKKEKDVGLEALW